MTILPDPLITHFVDHPKNNPPPPHRPDDPVVIEKPFVPIIEVPDLGPVEHSQRTIDGDSTPPPPTN